MNHMNNDNNVSVMDAIAHHKDPIRSLEECKTMNELCEASQVPAYRLLLDKHGLISLSDAERHELALFAARWSKRYEELEKKGECLECGAWAEQIEEVDADDEEEARHDEKSKTNMPVPALPWHPAQARQDATNGKAWLCVQCGRWYDHNGRRWYHEDGEDTNADAPQTTDAASHIDAVTMPQERDSEVYNPNQERTRDK